MVSVEQSDYDSKIVGRVYRALPVVNKQTYKQFEIEGHYIYELPTVPSADRKGIEEVIKRFDLYKKYCEEI